MMTRAICARRLVGALGSCTTLVVTLGVVREERGRWATSCTVAPPSSFWSTGQVMFRRPAGTDVSTCTAPATGLSRCCYQQLAAYCRARSSQPCSWLKHHHDGALGKDAPHTLGAASAWIQVAPVPQLCVVASQCR